MEDSEDDVELVAVQLRRNGYSPLTARIESAEAMRAALESDTWDLVLSDGSLSGFSIHDALSLLHETGLDLPFIIVSGTIAEEAVAAAMRAGARDFVQKDNLTRLGPAVERELRERSAREDRRRAEDELVASEARYRTLFNMSPPPMWAYDPETLAIVAVNDAATEYGYSRQELSVMTMADLMSADAPPPSGKIARPSGMDWPALHLRNRDGSAFVVSAGSGVTEIGGGQVMFAVGPLTGRPVAVENRGSDTRDDVMDLASRAGRQSAGLKGSRLSRPSLSAALAGRRVFLSDDDATFLVAAERALAAHGCLVELATTNQAARAYIERGPFDVVVTNVMMVGTSPHDLLRAMRERGDVDVPVVVVADTRHIQMAAEEVARGAFGYLSKPVEPSALLEAVRHAVEMHRMATLKRQALEITEAHERPSGGRGGLEVRFDRALDGLWVAFQPIVTWRQRAVYGYEALVRSDEPTLALPSDLFTAAERLERLHDLGRVIRARIAEAAVAIPPGCTLFVNVHAQDLGGVDLFSPWAPLTAIAPSVVLEITERSSLERVEGLGARLRRLRRFGFQIAVDDLGAGYAGLSSFSQLEPEVVKLDMSLVRGIDASSRRRSVVKAMLELAGRDLGMLVICEGVETSAERDTLAAVGADLLQGYLFAKPSRGFVVPSL